MEYGKSPQNPSPVVSLCIFDSSTLENRRVIDSSNLLTVVRDKDTNITHPNVVSVPTQRIPISLLTELRNTSLEESSVDEIKYFTESWIDNRSCNGHNPIVYAVESLLASKLGISDQLENRSIHFEAMLQAITTGKSNYPNLPAIDAEEYIIMASIIVFIDGLKNIFPAKTPSYSHIFWTKAHDFMRATRTKNNSIFPASLDPIEHCIYGLCISSTYRILADRYKIPS